MPMWSSVANLKESLSKIALDVHDEDDDDDELSIYTPPPSHDRFNNENSVPERRLSRRSNTPTHSPIVNGFNSPANHEIEQYKIEIRRLQDSEAEIKALSVNYAALLKEKEDQISRLSEENGTLKQNLLTTNDALSASKTALKGSGDLSPIRHNRAAVKTRSAGSIQTNGFAQKHDRLSNGSTSAKELSEMTEDKDGPFAVMQATYESQVKQMMMELDKERDKLSNVHVRLQDEQKLNASLQQELHSLKDDNGRMLKEMQKIRDELNQKISGIGRLQVELQRRDTEENNDTVEKLKKVISTLENENNNIKKEKDELEAALTAVRSSPAHKHGHVDLNTPNEHASTLNEAFPGKEEMQQSLQKLEKDLNETLQAKDKALLELTRLKQHLLEKASEESEKMDEDSKIIEELRETIEHQRFQISRLEQALKLAVRDQDETKLSNNNELKKAKEIIDELNRKLMSCKSTIDAKNMEVLNLQTALGQYYAEIEAKERLGEELSVAKEESTRLSKQLKEAHQQTEASAREKEEILEKLSQAESLLVEGKNRVKKLEEDNEKLRRALDQSMNRLNRMSVDSDFLVDRRIVIKLLVTYFQRNHSKEVLELMARMLGFSDEDKKRIGVAQQGTGKGVVRGVFGLPGRLVGGILGSGTAGVPSTMASDNQSFADLWVDFLLTETEREKREAMEAASSGSNQDQHKASPNAAGAASPLPNYTNTNTSRPNSSPLSSHGNFLHREHSESEFSTVPLSSSGSGSQNYRQLPRY